MYRALGIILSSTLNKSLYRMLYMKSLKERLDWAMHRMDPVPSVIEVADGCHVKRAAVYLWLDGTTKTLKPETCRIAARYFGVDRDWLETGIGDPISGATTIHNVTPTPSKPDADDEIGRIRSQLTDLERVLGGLLKRVEDASALPQDDANVPAAPPRRTFLTKVTGSENDGTSGQPKKPTKGRGYRRTA